MVGIRFHSSCVVFRVTLALMFGSSIEFNNFNLKPIPIQLILIVLRALETKAKR